MTFGAKRKAQRQPSFVSCYGDAISPSHWISPKALVLPGEVNPTKTTPDDIDQHSLFSTATGWSGAENGKPGTHKQPRHRPCSFNEPGHISREKKVLENHLSSFSFSKNLITSNWCCRHTTGAHPALFPRAAAPSTWGDRGMGAPWILLPRSVCWEQVGFTHGGRPVSPQEPRNKHGLCKN